MVIVDKKDTIRSFLGETETGHYVHFEWTIKP